MIFYSFSTYNWKPNIGQTNTFYSNKHYRYTKKKLALLYLQSHIDTKRNLRFTEINMSDDGSYTIINSRWFSDEEHNEIIKLANRLSLLK